MRHIEQCECVIAICCLSDLAAHHFKRLLVSDELAGDSVLSVADLCEWHRRWLGNVYDWAGQFRSVNMGKGEFPFAGAHLIPTLMADFESKFLVPLACYPEMNDEALIE